MANIDVKSANSWHIADNPSIYEPARNNNFEFLILDIDNLLKAGITEEEAEGDDSAYLKNSQEVIRLSVNKAPVPHFSQSEISVSRGNTKTYFAGPIEYKPGNVEVIDYVGASGKSVLMAWQALSGKAKDGTVGHAKDYKKTCILIEYDTDYSHKLRSWILKGCFITGLDESDFSHESADKKTVTATIRYDRAIPEE